MTSYLFEKNSLTNHSLDPMFATTVGPERQEITKKKQNIQATLKENPQEETGS
jgi:hypothetical protein